MVPATVTRTIMQSSVVGAPRRTRTSAAVPGKIRAEEAESSPLVSDLTDTWINGAVQKRASLRTSGMWHKGLGLDRYFNDDAAKAIAYFRLKR